MFTWKRLEILARCSWICLVLVFFPLSWPFGDSTASAQTTPTLYDLRSHLPTSAFEAGTGTIHIFATLPNGFGRRSWNSTSGWSPWSTYANNTGVPTNRWDTLIFPLSWYDGTILISGFRAGPKLNGFFQFFNTSGQSQLGTPSWHQSPVSGSQWLYTWAQQTPPAGPTFGESFFPTTGFTWVDGANYASNVFGGTRPENTPFRSLRELWYYAGSWGFADHGRPSRPGFAPNDIHIGANGAVFDKDRLQGYVFVSTENTNNLLEEPELYLRYWTRSPGWTWQSLGNPYGSPNDHIRAVAMSPPLAISRVEGGLFKIHVFVIVDKFEERLGLSPTQEWVLWERHFDGVTWRPWVDHGPLPGTAPVVSQSRTGQTFRLTSGVVYDDHGTLRINLFGNTSGGHLVEYYWTGSQWQYGMNIETPNHQPFRTISSAVDDHPNFEYITVLGRTDDGHIWELYWDVRVNPNWTWRQLY